MLNFLLSSLIVGSGIIMGGILSIIAKEELKPGKNYFILLKKILFASIIMITSIYYIKINPIISFFTLILVSILFIKKFQLNLMYIAFAATYILSTVNNELFILISALIFFAGFPIGSLAAYELTRKEIFVERKILLPYFIFILIIVLKTLFSFITAV